MEVVNKVVPSSEQMEGFAKPGPEGPIYMVNLLKFKEKAIYEDGRRTELSGREAYGLYARGLVRCLRVLEARLNSLDRSRDLCGKRSKSSGIRWLSRCIHPEQLC